MPVAEQAKSALEEYSARSAEYVSLLGDVRQAAAADVALIERWAHRVDGVAFDVGCDPGHWTHHLANMGIEAVGIDPVAEFIESARIRWPDHTFRVGRAESLDVPDGALGGILAWYSLIHMSPDELESALVEFARSLKQGGQLALGFFSGRKLERFEHAIATAYFWPIHNMEAHVKSAGFSIQHVETRTDPGARPHCTILAAKSLE